ncbi:MAG: hypothetical protein ABW166_09920 [Sedimenticola sp.]
MKKYILALLLSTVPFVAVSSDWKYELREIVSKTKKADGSTTYFFNMDVFDYYIGRIATHAKEYPPRFRSKEERAEVTEKLKKLIRGVSNLSENQQDNPEFLLRSAFIQSMAHNLNIKGAAIKAKRDFERVLLIAPNDIKANYLFGMFLSGTSKYHYDGIPYLEKALNGGKARAQFTLGLLYYQQGHKEKGMSYLRQYSQSKPHQEPVKNVISAIDSGNVEFNNY